MPKAMPTAYLWHTCNIHNGRVTGNGCQRETNMLSYEIIRFVT